MGNKLKKPNGFTLYTDLKPVVDRLPGDPMLKAMYNYICEGTEPSFEDDLSLMAWDLFKVKLDMSIDFHAKRAAAGRKGGYAKAAKHYGNLANSSKSSTARNAIATRQDRTRQDCLNTQPCSSPGGGLTAEDMKEYARLSAELDDDDR